MTPNDETMAIGAAGGTMPNRFAAGANFNAPLAAILAYNRSRAMGYNPDGSRYAGLRSALPIGHSKHIGGRQAKWGRPTSTAAAKVLTNTARRYNPTKHAR